MQSPLSNAGAVTLQLFDRHGGFPSSPKLVTKSAHEDEASASQTEVGVWRSLGRQPLPSPMQFMTDR